MPFLYRTFSYFATLLSSSLIFAETVNSNFTVSAQVIKGCAIGSANTQNAHFGFINFGTTSMLNNNIDIASTINAGSIVVKCTPGTTISMSLDYGLHGGNRNFRYLNNGTTSIAYQLYRDVAYSQVWGMAADGLAYNISQFPETSQNYTIYARAFSNPQMPPVGRYIDTVTLTLTY